MPDGAQRKKRNDSVKEKDSNLATPSKYKISYQAKGNKRGQANAAKARHDRMMRSTGRKKLATNYREKDN